MSGINNYAYESDWKQYVLPKQCAAFSSEEDIKNIFEPMNFTKSGAIQSGMPIISDGQDGYVNAETEMTIIFGGTGSKKTRTLIAPTICTLADSGESMIIMDIKGELSSGELSGAIRGQLKRRRYNTIFLDFRNLGSDGMNILEKPYKLYKAGQKDLANIELNNIAALISAVYRGTKADPYWELSAKQYFVGVCNLIFESCRSAAKVNMLTVASYCNREATDRLEILLRDYESIDNTLIMLKSILSLPEKTLACVVSSLNSMLEPFINNRKLLRMLSKSTFNINELYLEKTALFIIVPDEISTYDAISGMIIQQLTATLINDAVNYGGKLPRRVNVICDEFCNYQIKQMNKNISAHRSRNIRWYLVCQSLEQLQKCYPEDSGTILANCANLYYLNSSDLTLLNYLSEKSGVTTDNLDNKNIPLISVQQLQSLKKGWDYTEVYFTCRGMHFVTKLPDISLYYGFSHSLNEKFSLPLKNFNDIDVFTIEDLRKQLTSKDDLQMFFDDVDAQLFKNSRKKV